jgi:hypothetical protein
MAAPSLDDLFPPPPPPASALGPERWPGISAASTQALVDTVKDDFKRWHVFFNDKHFHKYVSLPSSPYHGNAVVGKVGC